MAEASISVAQDQISCPVCLDLLKDAVTLHCGHNYCKVCINRFWDEEDVRMVYSCPQCREIFTPRPVLRRNNMLAEMVEKQNNTELQAVSPAHCYAEPGEVECDSCIGRKRKAVNSCLVCLVSYCEDHLEPHYQSPAFKKHKLVEACELQEKICSQHDKLMEIYCCTDQSFICYLCMKDEHRYHDTVSTKAERTEKQNELKQEQIKSQQRSQEKEKKVQELKRAVDTIKMRSQAAVVESEKIFTELISLMEKKRSEVTELIRAQEKAELGRAERLLTQLEQEIADLKRRVTELEQLSHTHDDIHFLQMKIQVKQIRPEAVALFQILPSQLRQRQKYLQYFRSLTLDPNTAHHKLILSGKNRSLTCRRTRQQYSDHSERFDYRGQVLCKESVCGRCYWEVEWSGDVSISVSYKVISRKGQSDECVFGYNSQSWSLECSSSSAAFLHNSIRTDLKGPASSRIGVYVDHSAGTLSFYSVSDTMSLLHKVHTTFTQPLYVGFSMWHIKSTVRLCDSN